MDSPKDEIKTTSPWIKELLYDREIKKLSEDFSSDVTIIGGGISGFVTAFFTLRYTDKSVVLVEAGKIGHGATGHNAGQVVDYFEKYFSEIVEDYGLELASHGQNAVISAWNLLDFILMETNMEIPFSKFIGFAGCTNSEQLFLHFENKLLKQKGGVEIHKSKVSAEFAAKNPIPEKHKNLYELVSHAEILELLETENQHYIAALQSKKGCLNSALFVEKLEKYLSTHYKSRFQLFENTKVKKVFLEKNQAVLETETKLIDCKKVVLCTNGFENIEIINYRKGDEINRRFHKMIYSIVGYMAGFIEEKTKEPIAISYFAHKKNPAPEDPYFYLTRRNHKFEGKDKSLVVIGGPERIKDWDSYHYSKKRKYPNSAKEKIDHFLNKSFKNKPKDLEDFHFKWHGLMGYTESGIRVVGEEPANRILLYNLGCNGVGILPSIYGARKIADHIAGKPLTKTIFDPEVQRKVLIQKI